MAEQPGTGVAAERCADPDLRPGQPAGAPGIGRHQVGQALRERLAAASGVLAVEPAHNQPNAHLAPKRGKISRLAPVAAVHGPACPPAPRAAIAWPDATGSNVQEVRACRRDLFDAAARHGKEVCHGTWDGGTHRLHQPSVRVRHNPRKVRKNHQSGSIPVCMEAPAVTRALPWTMLKPRRGARA